MWSKKAIWTLCIIVTAVFTEATSSTGYKDHFSVNKWGSWKRKSAKGQFLHNKADGRNIKGCLEIVTEKGNPKASSFCFLKRFPVKPGKTYTASIWLKVTKTNANGKFYILFNGQDKEEKFLGLPTRSSNLEGDKLTKEWTRLVLTFTVPTTGKWAKVNYLLCTIGMKNTAEGRVLFDDFSFSETKSKKVKTVPVVINHNAWQLQIDSKTGNWLELKYKGQVISSNEQQLPSVDLHLGKNKWLFKNSPSELINYDWNKNKATLTLKLKSGNWRIDEIVQFDTQSRKNRLARSARLTYMPSGKNKQATKFYEFNFNYYLPKKGEYFYPATFFKDNHNKRELKKFPKNDISFDYQRRGPVSKLPHGKLRGYYRFWPVMIELNPKNTLLFVNDQRKEGGHIALSQLSQCIKATSVFVARGWAEPQVTQSIGPTYLEVCPFNAEQTLRISLARWYNDIGLKVPADRANWIYDATMYLFSSAGLRGSHELGGFKAAEQSLVPRIAELGFNSVWILPVQDGIIDYTPRDYYKKKYELGTSEEYKKMVQALHEKGIKVLQDIVPHGGSPWDAKFRGDSALRLIYDQNGNVLTLRAFDFGDPIWQKNMGKVSSYLIKEYELDGLRIDAPAGNFRLNWRRKGFPGKNDIPKLGGGKRKMDKKWWEKSLNEEGGTVPPLPYERASMGVFGAGLEILHAIREAVKKSNPDGVTIAEIEGSPFMQEADVLFDMSYYFTLQKMRIFSYNEFAFLLSQWLEEQMLAEPPGTLLLRYVQSHDWLCTRGWVGVSAKRAMIAVTYLIRGVPMIYQNKDIGNGYFIKKLNNIRKTLPELRRGEAFYQSVKSSVPSVFTVLRTMPGKSTIGLVNLSPKHAKTTVTLPLGQLTLPKDKELTLWNAFNGKKLGKGKIADFQNQKIELPPWGTAVLVWLPSDVPCPVKQAQVPSLKISKKASGNKLLLNEQNNIITVSGGNYSLKVNSTSGLIESFSNLDGSELTNSMDLIFGHQPLGKAQKAQVKITRKPDCIIIKSSIAVKGTGTVVLTYVCSAENVKLKAELSGFKDERNAGILFASPKATRFQINTAEGLLDDWYSAAQVRARTGWPVVTYGRYYRTLGSAVIWQAETCSLSLSDPIIRMFNNSKSGIQFTLNNPFSGGLDNCMLMDKFGTSVSLHTGFFWKQPGAVIEDIKALKKEFSVTLKAFANTPPVLKNQSLNIGKVKLSNESLDWVVENEHYRVRLRRTGGSIRDIWAKQQKVLENQDIITNKGFSADNTHYGVSKDLETGVRIRRKGGELHIYFSSRPHKGYGAGGSAILPIFVETEYIFDNSATFVTRWSIKSLKGLQGSDIFLAWQAHNPAWQKISNDSKKSPDKIMIIGKNKERMLTFSQLTMNPQLPNNDIFAVKDVLSIAMFKGIMKSFQVGKWYQASMAITPGKNTPVKKSPISWLKKNKIDADLSFEHRGTIFSYLKKRLIPCQLPYVESGMWWYANQYGQLDTKTVHSGKVSLQMRREDMWFRQNLGINKLPQGKYRLSAYIKGEKLKPDWRFGAKGSMLIMKLFYYDKAGKKHVLQKYANTTGSFDWKKVSKSFNVPFDCFAPQIVFFVTNNGMGAKFWLDDIVFSREK